MIRWGIVLTPGVMGAGGWGGASGCRGRSPGLLLLASWLLGGRAYGRDEPRPVLPHDGHLVGHREAGRSGADRRGPGGSPAPGPGRGLPGEPPRHAHRDPARR